jgi:hypothetical protein
MRKIEQEMLKAIRSRKNWSNANTAVSIDSDVVSVMLHGHKIAEIDFKERKMKISSCGYTTSTTKSRLNAILHEFSNQGIYQKNYEWFIGDKDFEDNMIIDMISI